MAVLEKLRVKFGMAVSIIIALGLLSFIIDPNEVISAFQGMSSKYDVGEINGKSVSYNNFQEDVQKFTTINELMTGSSVQSSEQQVQIRNAAWQDLIYKYLFIEKAREAGLEVGESEMLDLTQGDMLSPLVAQNPAFMDETGNFSKSNLVQFVKNLDSDQSGNLRLYWNYLQSSIYNQQLFSKYSSLFTQSNTVSPLMLDKTIAENNNTVDVEFVMVPHGYQRDSSVVVSDSEVKAFYKSHKKFYKQNASRDMEYVVFEVKPSEKDVNATRAKVADIYDEFAATDNMKSFLGRNSDRAFDARYYKEGELKTVSADVDAFVWSGNAGVSDIISNGDKFYVARVLDSREMPDSVYVKHILLTGDAVSKADSLAKVAGKEGFSNLAALYSEDKNSAADGELGNIGWMTQTYMISGMESVMEAQVGKPFVLNTDYGTHVVLVTKATKPILKKQVAVLKKTAVPSRETYNSYYAQANRFAGIAEGKYEGYRKAVDSLKLYSHNLTVTEATSNYGAIDQAKAVTRWVFDNKPGKASSIITVNNNYFFIAAVKSEKKAGYMPVEEVASTIQNRLYSEKIQQKTLEEVKAKLSGVNTIEAAAEALNVSVEHNEALSLSSGSIDPAVLGAASVAAEGQLYGPVAGSMGVYVVKVSDKQTGSFYTETDAKNLALQKSQYMAQMILSVMSEYDEVVDNRERFY